MFFIDLLIFFFKNQFVVLFAHIYHTDSEEHQEDKDVWGIEEMLRL